MTRILYVDTASAYGGAEVSLLELMAGLDRDAFSPLLLLTENKRLEQAAVERDIPVFHLSFPWFSRRRPWRYAASIARLAALIRSQKIDLVHTNCDHSLRYVMWACKLTGVPYVCHVRDFVRTWFQPSKVEALNSASRVIANSQAIARACRDAGVAHERVEVVYNPVNLDAFSDRARNSEAKEALGLPTTAIVVGLVGQVHPVKGHREFAEAALSIVADISDVYFLIVGEPHDAECDQFLQQLVSLCNAWEERVRFIGYHSDVAAIMSAIDILAVPSWTEPFGRVAVEGMAAGCAVVATRAGGLPEIVSDGQDGILVAPRDRLALEMGIRHLLNDDVLRARLSARARRSASRFTVARHVSKVSALYTQVTDRTRCV